MNQIASRHVISTLILSVLLAACGTARAQTANPADAQKSQSDAKEAPTDARSERLLSWQMPAVVVSGQPLPELREEDRVGSYKQPRWTATRRFPSTRVYVVPQGKAEVEFWCRPTYNKHGEPSETRYLYEIEFGLPHRFQLDLYYRTDQTGDGGDMLVGHQIELRYALADWGKLPGNPTLYFEYLDLEGRPHRFEPKLLLGGEISKGWHWGANLVAELEQGGERTHEYEFTGGISRTITDSRFSLGAETVVNYSDTAETRGTYVKSYMLGPSLQYRPLRQMTINIAAMAGLSSDSPRGRIYFNVGWEI